MTDCHCDYCNKEIDSRTDPYKIHPELRAIYCGDCSSDYERRCAVKRDQERTYSDEESE